ADGALAAASGAALLIVLAILVMILFDIVRNGTPHLSLSFLTQAPRDGMTAGGIFPAIVGMVEMVILMTLAGVPIGVATAIYLHEYASPVSRRSCSGCSVSASSSSFWEPASTRRSSTATRSSGSRR